MKNKLIPLVMTLVVGIILAGSLLIPVINDAQHAQDVKYTNSAPYSYGKIYDFSENDLDDTIIISVCKTGERSISINGETHNVSSYQPVVMSDAFTIRYYNTSMNFVTPSAGSKTITEATITISAGVATFTDVLNTSGTEITIDPEPITWAFVHDSTGDYSGLITENGITAYAHKNEIYTSNWITTTSEYFSGKAGDDFVTITDGTDSTTATINWGGEYLNDGVYKLTLSSTSDDYTFVVDNEGEDYTVHPFMVCVPKEVIGTPDDQQGINALYGVIPILVIVALLVTAIGAVYVRRND